MSTSLPSPSPLAMRALVARRVGVPLELAELTLPAPGPGQVRVCIQASGVNPLDLKIASGQAAHARQPLPAVLGLDLAGVVEAVAPDVRTFAPGDEVYGLAGGVGGVQGSLAEHAIVDARLLAPKPHSLTMRQAAALPLGSITAWEGLVDRAAVRAGQRVLVLGGAGGVGHLAVQLAHAHGATVFATGSTKQAATLAELGATALDRAVPMAEHVARHTGGQGFDVVFDTVGGAVLDDAFVAVRRYGHVVSALGWGTHALAPLSFRGATYSGIFTLLPLLTGEGREHHGNILREVSRLVERGALRPRLDPHHYSLETAHEAHAALAAHTNTGKVVVDVST
jgi:NADPH:quinone reductase